jgi:hypothetical protein
MLTQRRNAMDCAPWWDCQWPAKTQPLLSDLNAFYAGTDPGSALAILKRYDAAYVIADRSLPRQAGYRSFLTEVFRSDDTAVYRVGTGTKLTEAW